MTAVKLQFSSHRHFQNISSNLQSYYANLSHQCIHYTQNNTKSFQYTSFHHSYRGAVEKIIKHNSYWTCNTQSSLRWGSYITKIKTVCSKNGLVWWWSPNEASLPSNISGERARDTSQPFGSILLWGGGSRAHAVGPALLACFILFISYSFFSFLLLTHAVLWLLTTEMHTVMCIQRNRIMRFVSIDLHPLCMLSW